MHHLICLHQCSSRRAFSIKMPLFTNSTANLRNKPTIRMCRRKIATESSSYLISQLHRVRSYRPKRIRFARSTTKVAGRIQLSVENTKCQGVLGRRASRSTLKKLPKLSALACLGATHLKHTDRLRKSPSFRASRLSSSSSGHSKFAHKNT